MKGVELPINVLVIVAVAVIVLLGIAALFISGFSPFSTISGQESFKNKYCTEMTRNGCISNAKDIEIPDFDANRDDNSGPGYYGKTFTWDDPTTADNEALDKTVNTKDNLAALCAFYYGRYSETACKKLCVCPGY